MSQGMRQCDRTGEWDRRRQVSGSVRSDTGPWPSKCSHLDLIEEVDCDGLNDEQRTLMVSVLSARPLDPLREPSHTNSHIQQHTRRVGSLNEGGSETVFAVLKQSLLQRQNRARAVEFDGESRVFWGQVNEAGHGVGQRGDTE